jgi:hypothetical protein
MMTTAAVDFILYLLHSEHGTDPGSLRIDPDADVNEAGVGGDIAAKKHCSTRGKGGRQERVGA